SPVACAGATWNMSTVIVQPAPSAPLVKRVSSTRTGSIACSPPETCAGAGPVAGALHTPASACTWAATGGATRPTTTSAVASSASVARRAKRGPREVHTQFWKAVGALISWSSQPVGASGAAAVLGRLPAALYA